MSEDSIPNELNLNYNKNPEPHKNEGILHIFAGWGGTIVLATILVLFAGILGYYSIQHKKTSAALLEETTGKAQAAQQHGVDTKAHNNRLGSLRAEIYDPLYYISFWKFARVQKELTGIRQDVQRVYTQLLEEKSTQLSSSLRVLEDDLTRVEDVPLASKQEMIAYAQEMREDIDAKSIPLEKTSGHEVKITSMTTQLHGDTCVAMKELTKAFELELQEYNNWEYPSKWSSQDYLQTKRTQYETNNFTLGECVTTIQELQEKSTVVEQEVEDLKRQTLFASINQTGVEVDELLNFFSQRNGYEGEVNQLNQYKTLSAELTGEINTNTEADKLTERAENELFPLVSLPRQTKERVAEEERQALLAMQRQAGIPPAPIDAPKVIVINIGAQRLYAYENGTSIFDYPVPITTGKNGYQTVTGSFAIYHKTTNFRMRSPFPDVWYDNFVSYWMPFYQGYGLHDASWRSVYGTMDYPWVGSHGCVNIPHAEVERLYYWAEVGTPVIVI